MAHITSARDFFTWMWRQLEATEPCVAMEAWVAEGIEELFDGIQAGHVFRRLPVKWDDLMDGIIWEDIYSREHTYYGAGLLKAVGYLSAGIKRRPYESMDLISACAVLQHYWDVDRKYIGFADVRCDDYLVSTQRCERELLARIKVRNTDEAYGEPSLIWEVEYR